MTFSWGEVKAEIERLYMKEGKSLLEVRDILKATHKFNPSIRAYKDKLEEWGYRKYNRCRKEAAATLLDLPQDLGIVQTTEMASALLAGSDSDTVKCNLTQVEHELERQSSDVREQQIILGKVSRKRCRQHLESDTEECKHSLERMAKLETEFTHMRKTLEKVMTSVNAQTRVPTGLTSCWKQEPMTLEDAHGKLLPLPLELVVSWEMFDSILLGHFRTLAGEKKVRKKEFEIEDSVTGGTLTRTSPWSQISKPGRKIEMSMIFKDISKTSVACPKCDTISKEKKGVQVECPNPDCKMIFRTEDDENPDAISSGSLRTWRTMGTKSRPRRASSMDQEEHCEEDPEDLPGMFKRVIIRLLRSNVDRSSHNIQSFGSTQIKDLRTESRPLAPSMFGPELSSTSKIMDTWVSGDDHLMDIGVDARFSSLLNPIHSENVSSPAPVRDQTLEMVPMDLFDSIFWDQNSANNSDQLGSTIRSSFVQTAGSAIDRSGGNEILYLPLGAAFFQNIKEQGVMQTAEGVSVFGMDLLDFMALDF